jgi:hypothetical protein
MLTFMCTHTLSHTYLDDTPQCVRCDVGYVRVLNFPKQASDGIHLAVCVCEREYESVCVFVDV